MPEWRNFDKSGHTGTHSWPDTSRCNRISNNVEKMIPDYKSKILIIRPPRAKATRYGE